MTSEPPRSTESSNAGRCRPSLGTSLGNRIVTRGFGVPRTPSQSAGIIVSGFTGVQQDTQPTGTPIVNRIVTRGLGVSKTLAQDAGLIVKGYGGVHNVVEVEVVERPIRLRFGGSGSKRQEPPVNDVIVYARLIEVNGRVPRAAIRGWVNVRDDRGSRYASAIVEHIISRVRATSESIKVTVRRLRRDT